MFRRSIFLAAALGLTVLVPLGASVSAKPGAAAPGLHPAVTLVIPHPGAQAPGLHPAGIPLPASRVGPFVNPNVGGTTPHGPLVVARPGVLNHSVANALKFPPKVDPKPPVPPMPPTPPIFGTHGMKGPWWKPIGPMLPGGVITSTDPVVVGAPPATVQTPGTVTSVAGARPLTTAPTSAASEPCSCLTKQYLDDGSVLFRDICTREAALATPDDLKAQAQN